MDSILEIGVNSNRGLVVIYHHVTMGKVSRVVSLEGISIALFLTSTQSHLCHYKLLENPTFFSWYS
jgi:hypothetical protein